MRNALVVAGLIIYGQFGICSAPAGVYQQNLVQFTNGEVMTSEQAQELLKAGKLFPQTDPSLVVPWAVDKDRLDLLPLLVHHPIYKKTLQKPSKETGLSPLSLAAVKGRCDAAVILMEAGADKYFRDGEKMTPFIRAAFNGQHNMLRLLYTHAHDKNKMVQATFGPAGQKQNALHLAAQGTSLETVALLVQFYQADSIRGALELAYGIKENFEFNKQANPGFSDADLKKVNEYIIKLLEYSVEKKSRRNGCYCRCCCKCGCQ